MGRSIPDPLPAGGGEGGPRLPRPMDQRALAGEWGGLSPKLRGQKTEGERGARVRVL